MDAKQAIDEGLRIYREDMQALIREKLQAEYGGNWCLERVVPVLPRGKQGLIAQKLAQGESPEHQVDVNDFGLVIENFSDLFPEPIRQGEHHHRFEEIKDARNEWAHPSGATPRRADAEAVLAACSDVLRQCGLLSSAQAIEDIVSGFGQQSTSAPARQAAAMAPNDSTFEPSPASAPPGRPERRKVGEDQPCTARERALIQEGLQIYHSAMGQLIGRRLHATYGENWFQEKVLPLRSRPSARMDKMLADEGQAPERLIRESDFPRVIREYGGLFSLRILGAEGQHRMSAIVRGRNRLMHNPEFTLRDGEVFLASCSHVLRQCGLGGAATEIDVIAHLL